MSLIKLFFIFVKIGAILLGGGYVILPIMTSEFVEKRNIMTHDELLEIFALSQSLPGIIAANMSMFVGYRLYGISGAILAMTGIVLVPFICIVLLASALGILAEHHIIKSALWGVGIALIALILLTIREMWQNSDKNLFFYFIFCFALLSLIVFKLSPAIVIILFSVIGVIYKRIARAK